jgi:hypothetical protein
MNFKLTDEIPPGVGWSLNFDNGPLHLGIGFETFNIEYITDTWQE